jgi:putative Mn2+ efflux pump MntP
MAIGEAADYIAIGILAAFGLYTLLADDDDRAPVSMLNATGWRALALGVSISLDELAVGFTLGLLRLPVLLVIAAIAAQTLVVTQPGMRLGAHLGEQVRERAEQLAGVALIALAGVLLTEKLAS